MNTLPPKHAADYLRQSGVQQLIEIVRILRDPDIGCPWDIKQTHESLAPYLIEESYETIDAIQDKSPSLPQELGDVLLQVVMHAQLGSELGRFDFNQIVEFLSAKLIRRHPHVFSPQSLTEKPVSAADVTSQWEKQKERENREESITKSLLEGVPKSLPALQRAQRISEKVARIGFEWPDFAGVKDKVKEELEEFVEVCGETPQNRDRIEDEFGDVFFSLVQLARRMDLDAEGLLQKATNKFLRRFQGMEKLSPTPLGGQSIEELQSLWIQVKESETPIDSNGEPEIQTDKI